MEYKIKPWKHQLEAIERASKLDNYALLLDPGLGKSMTAINILRNKYMSHKRLLRTLILAPPIVLKNWKDEWLKFSKIKDEDILILYGEGKKRVKLLQEQGFAMGEALPKVVITNYESLLMKDLLATILEWRPEAVVFDESQRLKNPTSGRTKQAIKISSLATYRYILTGTPVLNSAMDLFSQFLCLDQGATFGKNFFAFRGTYFRDRNAGMPAQRYFPNWQILEGALEAMNLKVKKVASIARKSECLDLPPYIQQTLKVDMLPEQRRMYLEMKKDFVTFVEGTEVVATMAMTKALRLMQIASGFAKDVDGKEHSLGVTPKMEALEDLLESIAVNHKVIVWVVWRENYGQVRHVCEKLKLCFCELTGDTAASKRFEIVDAFNQDPKVRVLIAHPGAGGVGINLIAASYSIFYSRTFSLEHSLQAEARNYRGGSEIHEKITRIDLVTEGTIDEIVLEKLKSKEEVSFKILCDMKDKL